MTRHKKTAEQKRLNRMAKIERFETYYKAASPAKRAAIYLCLLPLTPIGYALLALSWVRSKRGEL